MKIGIIIQARLNSTRFRNKVLAPIFETKTVIEEIINRAKLVQHSSVIVVATSNEKNDDELVDFLKSRTDVVIYRGSEENVLSRYCDIGKNLGLSHIVRLTGDNPCIDPKAIDDTIEKHLAGGFDYSYTKGYPLGMNIEVVANSALQSAAKNGKTQADREHVTFFVRNNPQRFKLNFIDADLPKAVENLRLTFDTPQDYLMLRILFDYLKSDTPYFTINDILNLWQSKPYIFSINDTILQKMVYENENEELKAASQLLEKQEMYRALAILKNAINDK
jgi:spore coat polysaccharide biosynthesis protein SpsF